MTTVSTSINVPDYKARLAPCLCPDQAPHAYALEGFQHCLNRFDGIGRGMIGNEARSDGNVVVYSLAEMFAKRVAGRHNKNVIFILFGDLGSGKSMTLLKLALSCAMWLTALKGGPISKYFQFSNVAVIDPEMLQDKMANLQQYQIMILDDAGPGYDARNFMSKTNKDLNYILQTCRTTNNIILVSAPHGAMLDVTIHRVAQYYAEVAESHHEHGLSFIKVFRLVRNFREGKIFYVYMTKGGLTIKRFVAGLPPAELKVKYDIVREEQAKIIAQRRAEREAAEQERRENKGKRPERAEKLIDIEKVEEIRKYVSENKFETKTRLEAKFNLSQRGLTDIMVFGGLRQVKIGKQKEWELDSEYGSPKK